MSAKPPQLATSKPRNGAHRENDIISGGGGYSGMKTTSLHVPERGKNLKGQSDGVKSGGRQVMFKSCIPVLVTRSKTRPRPPLGTIQCTSQPPTPTPSSPPPPCPPVRTIQCTSHHHQAPPSPRPLTLARRSEKMFLHGSVSKPTVPPSKEEEFQPDPLSRAEILGGCLATPTVGVVTPARHPQPCSISGRFIVPPSHRGSIFNSRRKKYKAIENEVLEKEDLFHRLVQSSIKSNRSKMRRDDDSNGIAIKLETRLDVDDVTSSATPVRPRPHIYGCSRLVPAMDVNFYQIEDELVGIKWEVGGLDGNHPKWDDHQVGGHLPHSTAPVAKLLDQCYFVPVSEPTHN